MIRSTYPRLYTHLLVALSLALTAGCKSSHPSFDRTDSSSTVEAASTSDLSGPPTLNATYGARNPRVCRQLTTPPNAAQAAALVQCNTESDSTGGSTPQLTLLTDVQVEVGSPRPYIAGTDDATEIDPSAKVYPIRGGGTLWQCPPVAYFPGQANCYEYKRTNTSNGRCFKTTFGNYECLMPTGGPEQLRNQQGPTTY